jgi:hypothetical protein
MWIVLTAGIGNLDAGGAALNRRGCRWETFQLLLAACLFP